MQRTDKIIHARCPYCFHTTRLDNYWIIEPVGCETDTDSAQTKKAEAYSIIELGKEE